MQEVVLKKSEVFVEQLAFYEEARYELARPIIYPGGVLDSNISRTVQLEHQKEVVDSRSVSVSRLSNVVVNPNGSLVDSSGCAIYESTHDFASGMEANKTTVVDEVTGSAILLFKYGYKNYGHWLIEMLPKLYFLGEVVERFPEAKIVIGKTEGRLRTTVISTLSKFGIEESRLVEIDNSTLFEELIYCSPITNHPYRMRPEIRKFHRQLVPPNIKKEQKIFVTRPVEGTRVLSNIQEIESYFRDNDYIVVDPGEVTFDDQLELFAGASKIVGIAGAAMTNTVFSSSDATIMYIVPSSMPNLFFYQLASICGQGYGEFRGLQDEDMFGKEFAIDFPALRSSLRKFDAAISN